MKNIFLVLILLAFPFKTTANEGDDTRPMAPEIITLESPVIEFVDGKTGLGIDAQVYGMMMKLCYAFEGLRSGIKQTDGTFIGSYTFNGKKVTAIELAGLEAQGISVSHLLASAKQEVHQKIQPMIQIARNSKQHMVILIQEWATKAKRANTHLLQWASTPDGQEQQSLETNITSFKAFEQFLADMAHFLKSMLRSCPKAYKQFKDLVNQKLQQQQQHRP